MDHSSEMLNQVDVFFICNIVFLIRDIRTYPWIQHPLLCIGPKVEKVTANHLCVPIILETAINCLLVTAPQGVITPVRHKFLAWFLHEATLNWLCQLHVTWRFAQDGAVPGCPDREIYGLCATGAVQRSWNRWLGSGLLFATLLYPNYCINTLKKVHIMEALIDRKLMWQWWQHYNFVKFLSTKLFSVVQASRRKKNCRNI